METLLSSFFNISPTDSFVCLFIKIYCTQQDLGRKRARRGRGGKTETQRETERLCWRPNKGRKQEGEKVERANRENERRKLYQEKQ